MLKLIVEVPNGVDYQAYWTDIYPLTFSSKENFLFLLELFITENAPKYHVNYREEVPGAFSFNGIIFPFREVCYYENSKKLVVTLPEVFTVEEWFDRKEAQQKKDWPDNRVL